MAMNTARAVAPLPNTSDVGSFAVTGRSRPVGAVLGRALFHAIERIPRLAIGRIGAHHFRVLDDRAVVVLRLFGAMSGSQPGGGRASKQTRERQRRSAGANINGPANQHR